VKTRIPLEHFQRIFEALPGAFLLLLPDSGFTIAGVSDEYLRGTLKRRELILGRPVFEVFPDNPLTPEANSTRNLRLSLERIVTTRASDVMAVQRYDVPCADGPGFEARYWSPVNAPVLDADGELLYIVHRVDNVTDYVLLAEDSARQRNESERLTADKLNMEAEIVQRSRELDRLNGILREANETLSDYARVAREEAQRKDEFLAMLAHELRNPLAAISSALQLWGLIGSDARRQQEVLAVCKRQVGNLTRLVDDLLETARISRGEVELQRTPLALQDVLRSALQAARVLFERQDVAIVTRVTPAPCLVFGDSTRLEQVYANLLSNAAKFSPRGGQVEVLLDVVEADGRAWARVEVGDQGRGIPPDKLDAIFDMFVQVETRIDRACGGLGIGLSLVRALAELHGGRVRVHSAGLGQGSRFTVDLPLLSGHETQPQPAPATGIAEAALPPACERLRRVLVVEDNIDARQTLRDLLAASGYEVFVAGDGDDGLAQILQRRPDLAIVDIGLPGLDGFEVARRARSALGGDAPRLVALTGYSSLAMRRAVLEAGFDLHLVKPLGTAALADVLAGPGQGWART
jgi:signal transduction histidine kinase